eukprot:06128.XXX_31433_31591_1 [CDS] Oithona nana genome sequencing.
MLSSSALNKGPMTSFSIGLKSNLRPKSSLKGSAATTITSSIIGTKSVSVSSS